MRRFGDLKMKGGFEVLAPELVEGNSEL